MVEHHLSDSSSPARRPIYPVRMLIAWLIPQGLLLLVVWLLATPTSPREIFLTAVFLGTPALVALVICVLVHLALVFLDRTRIRHYLFGFLLAIHPLFLHEFFLGYLMEGASTGLMFSLPALLIAPLPFAFWWLHYRVLRRLTL